MLLVSAFQLLLCLIPLALAAPAAVELDPLGRRACATLHVRKEWRDLTVAERADYIRGVKCLQTLPATAPRAGVVTRFDEFQWSHVNLAPIVHQVGQFLVWHRHHLTLYAQAMREECNYKGPATYWDWTRDADSTGGGIRASPIFDPNTGFGGDGSGAGGCVTTGPFANMTVRLGPGNQVRDHCLTRRINEGTRSAVTSANVRNTMAETTFERFRTILENGGGSAGFGIHNGGHGAIGGEASNPVSSPGDPLFYLHHGNLDRVWWKWQIANRTSRLYDVSGRTTQQPPYTQLTLDSVLGFTSLTPSSIAVRDLMNIEAEPACSTYFD